MESKEYYQSVAEAREFESDTVLKSAIELITLRGVIYSMIADVTLYGSKNGRNEKYKDSLSKLMQIDSFIDKCNNVSDHNYMLRYQLRTSMLERDKLQQENELLKNQIEATRRAFDEE